MSLPLCVLEPPPQRQGGQQRARGGYEGGAPGEVNHTLTWKPPKSSRWWMCPGGSTHHYQLDGEVVKVVRDVSKRPVLATTLICSEQMLRVVAIERSLQFKTSQTKN